MTDKVLDASAVAAMVFLEKDANAISDRIRGHDWFAPTLLKFEMANICAKKLRAHPEKREIVLMQFASSLDAPVQYHDVDYAEIIALTERFKLSAYDASYLWLARHLKAELVTLDVKLEKAAQAFS